jgi:hypothetical protein
MLARLPLTFPRFRRGALEVGLAVLVVLSLVRFFVEVGQVRRICCADFGLFWEQVVSFRHTGVLYPYPLSDYTPAAPAFKFPPFYAATLWPWAAWGVDGAAVRMRHLTLQAVLHLAALGLCLVAFLPRHRVRVAGLVLVLALNHGPFFETLWRLQAENWVLFLLALAMALFCWRRDAAAGTVLATAAALKLYPFLLLAFPIAARRWRAVAGFAAGSVVFVGISLALFGWRENRRFWFELAPYMAADLPIDSSCTGPGIENVSVTRYLMYRDETAGQARDQAKVLALILVLGSWAAVAQVAAAGARPAALGLALFVPAILVWLPNSWANYQLLLLLPLLGVVLARGGRIDPAPGLAAAVAYLSMAYHQQIHDYPLVLPRNQPLFLLCQTLRIAAPLLLWLALLWQVLAAAREAPSARMDGPSVIGA